jgi:hypothetical protein
MFKHRKMRFNGEWSLLAGNRVYELTFARPQRAYSDLKCLQNLRIFFEIVQLSFTLYFIQYQIVSLGRQILLIIL